MHDYAMFSKMGALKKLFKSSKNHRLIMVGLDNAGKTTILYKLKMGEIIVTIPTIGFNVETVKYNNVSFTVWDMGGQSKIRPLWRHYYHGVQGLIFVIDATDRERLTGSDDSAKSELHNILKHDEMSDIKILIFANKSDIVDSLSVSDIVDSLDLRYVKQEWKCIATSGLKNIGIYEGLEWLTEKIK